MRAGGKAGAVDAVALWHGDGRGAERSGRGRRVAGAAGAGDDLSGASAPSSALPAAVALADRSGALTGWGERRRLVR